MSYSVSTQHQPLGSGEAQSIVYTPPSTESSSEHDFDITQDREDYDKSMEEARYQDDSSPEPMQYMYGKHEDDEGEDVESVVSMRGNSVAGPSFDQNASRSASSPVMSRRSIGKRGNGDYQSDLRRMAGESIAEMQQKIKDLERLRIKEQQSTAEAKLAYHSEQEEMIFRLETKHNAELLQLKQEQAAKLRETRKSSGYNTELVQGLHRSYGKQMENLILEVTDLEKTNEVLRARMVMANAEENSRSEAASAHAAKPETDTPTSDLQVKIQFVSFKTTYDVPSIEVPHPGTSFGTLSKNVKCAISNYLAFLRSKDSIHSSSADSALIYRLSLNLDECTKLLFFGKGDPNGEEITEDKWVGRGLETYDLIACISPPRMPPPAVVIPPPRTMSVGASSHISEKTARQYEYEEPPATATSVETGHTSTIWGKTPTVQTSYKSSSYYGRDSIMSAESSERSSSPGRLESPVMGSKAQNPAYATNAFDVSREIRRINSELNKLQGSRHSTDDLSSQDDDEFEPAPKLNNDYHDAFQAGGLAGYLRAREPLLQQAAEAGDYEEHVDANEDDDEESESHARTSTASRKSSTISRKSGASYTYSVYKRPVVNDSEDDELELEVHDYQMVGNGVDETLRQDDNAEDDGEVDDQEGVHLSSSQQLAAQQGQSGTLPLYVDEFLMGPVLDRTLEKGKGRASPAPSNAPSTKEGTFPELEHLSERQSNQLPHRRSSTALRSHSRTSSFEKKSDYSPMSPVASSKTGSRRFSRLAESEMEEPLLEQDEYLPSRVQTSGVEAEAYGRRKSDTSTNRAGLSSSTFEGSRSRASSTTSHRARGSTSSTKYPSTYLDNVWESEKSPSHRSESPDTVKEVGAHVQKPSAAAAFAALPTRATQPLSNPHSQQPQAGVYGFPQGQHDEERSQPPVHAPDPPLDTTSPSPTREYIAPRMDATSSTSSASTNGSSTIHSYSSTRDVEAQNDRPCRYRMASPRQYLELDDNVSGEATPTLESIRRAATVPTTYDEYFTTQPHHQSIYPPQTLPPPQIRSALMPSNPYSQLYQVQQQPPLPDDQRIFAHNALAAAGVDITSLSPTQFYEFATSPPSTQREALGYADLGAWTRRSRPPWWHGQQGNGGVPRFDYGGPAQGIYGYPSRDHERSGPQWPW